MRPRWKDILVRSTLLFLVSVALVVGFWYHTEFYRFGLLPLLAIGGLATFLVIAALRFILSGTLSGYWAFDEFVLSSPAVSDGQIFIRTSGHLYAIGQRKKS